MSLKQGLILEVFVLQHQVGKALGAVIFFILQENATVSKPNDFSKALQYELTICIFCSLQKIQDRAFHLIESPPIKDKMASKRLSVEKIITYDRAIMVHKILRKRYPGNLKGKFTRRNQISKYETRRMYDLQIPKLRSEFS